MDASLDKLPVGIPAVIVGFRQSPFTELSVGTQVIIFFRSAYKKVTVLGFCGKMLALPNRELRGIRVQWERL